MYKPQVVMCKKYVQIRPRYSCSSNNNMLENSCIMGKEILLLIACACCYLYYPQDAHLPKKSFGSLDTEWHHCVTHSLCLCRLITGIADRNIPLTVLQ